MAQSEPITDTEALDRLMSHVRLQVQALGRASVICPVPFLVERFMRKLKAEGFFVTQEGRMWVIERAF